MTTEAPTRRNRLLLAAIVMVAVIGLDLWTKQWAWVTLKDGPPIRIIDGLLHLKFGFNTGSAFSLLRDASWARGFFVCASLAAFAYMAWLANRVSTKHAYSFAAIGMLAGGALGNLHDRFFRSMPLFIDGQLAERHGVVDFVQFFYPWSDDGAYWPIFNVADSSLVCGVILLLIYTRWHGKHDEAVQSAKKQTT